MAMRCVEMVYSESWRDFYGEKEHELSIIINLGVWIYEVVYWGRYNTNHSKQAI